MALIGLEGGETWPPSTQQEAGVKEYEVTVNGVHTTLLLSDADAKARGLTVEAKQAKTPANKARTSVPNKQATAGGEKD